VKPGSCAGLTGESDGAWCNGAVVAVTFGILGSLELGTETVVDDCDSFQKAVGKLM
jgi:hypothetical protein